MENSTLHEKIFNTKAFLKKFTNDKNRKIFFSNMAPYFDKISTIIFNRCIDLIKNSLIENEDGYTTSYYKFKDLENLLIKQEFKFIQDCPEYDKNIDYKVKYSTKSVDDYIVKYCNNKNIVLNREYIKYIMYIIHCINTKFVNTLYHIRLSHIVSSKDEEKNKFRVTLKHLISCVNIYMEDTILHNLILDEINNVYTNIKKNGELKKDEESKKNDDENIKESENDDESDEK